MQTFSKQTFTELWITLASNETLGILDSDYLEDYFGTDGQVTLYHLDSDTRFPVLMNELALETPSIPHDVFTGFIEVDDLPLGVYRVEGRVRDVHGNYRILSEVQSPTGTEDVVLLEILVTASFIVVVFPDIVKITLGAPVTLSVEVASNVLTTLTRNDDSSVVISTSEQVSLLVAKETSVPSLIAKEGTLQTPMMGE